MSEQANPMAEAMNAVVNAPTPQAKAAALENWERLNMGGGAAPAPSYRPPTPGAANPGSSDALAQAVRDAQGATTPQQKADALARIERLNMERAAGVAPRAGAGGSVSDAMARVEQAPTPADRRAALEDLEAAHRDAPAAAEGPEGFPAPTSAQEYQFVVPPGAGEIVNDEAAGEIRTALFDAKVPAEFANMAFQNAARNFAAGVLESDESYTAAALAAKAAVEKQLGAEAPAALKLAVDYLNDLLAERPALQEAIDLAMVDPWSLMQAANLARTRRIERSNYVGAPNAAEAAKIRAMLAAADETLAARRRSDEAMKSVERLHATLAGRR